MKKSNLIPNSERSPEELREMGRRGGIQSGKSRRKKAQIKKNMKILATMLMESDEWKDLVEDLKKRLRER